MFLPTPLLDLPFHSFIHARHFTYLTFNLPTSPVFPSPLVKLTIGVIIGLLLLHKFLNVQEPRQSPLYSMLGDLQMLMNELKNINIITPFFR